MGCIQVKRTKIVAMKTIHHDEVFTSTTNIRSLYTFEKILGHGSFGSVKLARHKLNNQLVAIKIIEKAKLKGKEALLATEIYILQRLDHPNIIKFYEVYQDELFLYLCMENCSGGELFERIAKSSKPLNELQVQAIVSKIMSAVSYVHDKGIVHRDIKPENIMFSDKTITSEPKLIDFGLSNKFDTKHLKRLKTFVGTPIYLPPEILEGEYDEKCDVWSLGILLYILLCGYPPFSGKNKQQLYQNIQDQQLRFGKNQWKLVSLEAQDLITKLLQKNPAKRVSVAQALQHVWFKLSFPKLQHEITNKIGAPRNTIIALQLETEENKHILQMLKNFRNGAKFKKEVRKVLINQMNEKDLQTLKLAFQKIDVDNSGTITVDELQKAMIDQGCEATIQEIEKLIETISLDQDEVFDFQQNKEGDLIPQVKKRSIQIKYSDFLAAAIDERKIFTKEKLWSLFKYFDINGCNYLTRDDIREAFARHGRHIELKKIDEMIQEIDPNHDGKITFDEFTAMMGVEGVEQTLEIKD